MGGEHQSGRISWVEEVAYLGAGERRQAFSGDGDVGFVESECVHRLKPEIWNLILSGTEWKLTINVLNFFSNHEI